MTKTDKPDIPPWIQKAVDELCVPDVDDQFAHALARDFTRVLASHAPKEAVGGINERLLEVCKKLMTHTHYYPSGSKEAKEGNPEIDKIYHNADAAIAEADSYIPHYKDFLQIARLVVGAQKKFQLCNREFALSDIAKAWKLAAPILEEIDGEKK